MIMKKPKLRKYIKIKGNHSEFQRKEISFVHFAFSQWLKCHTPCKQMPFSRIYATIALPLDTCEISKRHILSTKICTTM